MFRVIRLVVYVCALTLAGCAAIPPEAPELSAELGQRISAIESSNITLLQRFFDQKRGKWTASSKMNGYPSSPINFSQTRPYPGLGTRLSGKTTENRGSFSW